MTSLFRTCLDGHRCENGSSCAEHPTEEGKYYCDCNTSSGDFSGLFCEYQAETYCQMPQETTESWFCSNMGTCVLSTGGQGAQWNCDCPSDFEGPHCQFIKGNVPRDWPGFDFDPSTGSIAKSKKEGGLHIAVTIFLGVAAFFILAGICFFVVRKIRNREPKNQHATRDPSEGLKLEADGSVLQEVMQQFQRTPNSTPNGNGTHEGFDLSLSERSSDNHSIEIGMNGNGYSDHPHHRNGRRNGTTNEHIL
mmetsp:Transcript_21185/g.52495  ORF Transcript_21185/g.52495 Transcript_21185/m.52495 type:complete len:250 (-) Transcript_21185:214-963(-)|eukprot:CAMPEP_0116090722 /NCGR_PEP_ID=MMETSP0327-20121206/7122_1 /TAXON_ID=44447 /ORGANISM="Pseudo-nitzschia delicatissima, Strain B596" /LENGTH=249 /DNA_ID=CAMNT_0003582023 /DNA_START=280 /DNA_END=1029 /DNA_ORIENTATION=+